MSYTAILPLTTGREQTLIAEYAIAQVISAGINRNGIPLPHLKNRMKKAEELKRTGRVQKIIIGNRVRSLADDMRRYLENELYLPPTSIETVYGGWGTAGELLHGRRKVKQMMGRGVYFYVITSDWAAERTRVIADCILRNYGHEVIGTLDGRMEWINDKVKEMLERGEVTEEGAREWIETVKKHVESDLQHEPRKHLMYNCMLKIPPIAQNRMLLDSSEPLFTIFFNPSLFFTYAKEFSKGLRGRGQEIYRSGADVYNLLD